MKRPELKGSGRFACIAKQVVVYDALVEEKWRATYYPDYFVSKDGEILSAKWGKQRVLRQHDGPHGYQQVCLSLRGRRKTKLVARIVATAFISDPPSPSHTINHKNGDKKDNRSCNLEWATPSENQQHSYDVLGKAAPRGERNGAHKLLEAGVRDIRLRFESGESAKALASEYCVHVVTIRDAVRGRRWGWLK